MSTRKALCAHDAASICYLQWIEVAWTQHISNTSILPLVGSRMRHSATNHGTMYTRCLSCYHPTISHHHIYLHCFCKAATQSTKASTRAGP